MPNIMSRKRFEEKRNRTETNRLDDFSINFRGGDATVTEPARIRQNAFIVGI